MCGCWLSVPAPLYCMISHWSVHEGGRAVDMSDLAADQKAPETCSLVAVQARGLISTCLCSVDRKNKEKNRLRRERRRRRVCIRRKTETGIDERVHKKASGMDDNDTSLHLSPCSDELIEQLKAHRHLSVDIKAHVIFSAT